MLSDVELPTAQPGTISTARNTGFILPASTLVTNGIPGLSGPPANLMVAAATIVQFAFTPTITQTMTFSADQLVISGGGGVSGDTYQILTTTNLALPPDQWTPLATNQLGQGGSFSHTNVLQPDVPAQYFRLVLP